MQTITVFLLYIVLYILLKLQNKIDTNRVNKRTNYYLIKYTKQNLQTLDTCCLSNKALIYYLYKVYRVSTNIQSRLKLNLILALTYLVQNQLKEQNDFIEEDNPYSIKIFLVYSTSQVVDQVDNKIHTLLISNKDNYIIKG